VRWQDQGSVGIAFDKQLPFPDVARWIADSHRALVDRDEAPRPFDGLRNSAP
jgi:hypothetical protein